MIGRILRHLWAFWAILWFGLVALVLLPITALAMKLARKGRQLVAGQSIIKVWAKILLWGMGMPITVRGKEHIPRESCIFVVNHVSMLDILANVACIPPNTMWLSKKEVTKIPVAGYLVKRLHLLVDRSSKESRRQAMRDMQQAMANGYSLNLYPEGTRNKGPQLVKSFYDGAFQLAVQTGKPIVPITILDNWKRQNGHMPLQLRPGRVRIVFDPPIDTTGTTEQDIDRLKKQVAGIMRGHLEPVYGKEYPMPK